MQTFTQPELFTADLMKKFGPAIAMVGYTNPSSLSEIEPIICGSGFILEGQFLITASVVHDALSWHEKEALFAAVIDGGSILSECESGQGDATGQRQKQGSEAKDLKQDLRYIPITFIDSDAERGIAVYQLNTKMPAHITFADIDFAQDGLLTGVNALALSYCAANESFRCNRTPILMSAEVYVRAGGSYSGTAFPLTTNQRTYSIIAAMLEEQECGAPIIRAGTSGVAPPQIIGIVGGSLESMYRDFIIVKENPQLCIAWPFVGFTNSSLFKTMNEEITSNTSLINDAATLPYQSQGTSQQNASSVSSHADDDDALDDIDAFMDEFDMDDPDGLLGNTTEDDF